jgi:crotonyl-CoA carboxylase/reductase
LPRHDAVTVPPADRASDPVYTRRRAGLTEEVPAIFAKDTTRVVDIFHSGVITCPMDTHVDEVARLLVDYGIHAVVVLNPNGSAVGVVSQTDVVLARQGRSKESVAELTAALIMSPNLLTCRLDDTVTDVVTVMTSKGVHRLVVAEERDGRRLPVGVVSMTDVIRGMIGAPRDPDQCHCRDAT